MDHNHRDRPLNVVFLKEKERKGQEKFQVSDLGVLESLMLSSCDDGLLQVYHGDWEPSRHRMHKSAVDLCPQHQAWGLHVAFHLVVDRLQSQLAQAAVEG